MQTVPSRQRGRSSTMNVLHRLPILKWFSPQHSGTDTDTSGTSSSDCGHKLSGGVGSHGRAKRLEFQHVETWLTQHLWLFPHSRESVLDYLRFRHAPRNKPAHVKDIDFGDPFLDEDLDDNPQLFLRPSKPEPKRCPQTACTGDDLWEALRVAAEERRSDVAGALLAVPLSDGHRLRLTGARNVDYSAAYSTGLTCLVVSLQPKLRSVLLAAAEHGCPDIIQEVVGRVCDEVVVEQLSTLQPAEKVSPRNSTTRSPSSSSLSSSSVSEIECTVEPTVVHELDGPDEPSSPGVDTTALLEMLQHAAKAAVVNCCDEFGRSLLHFAAAHGQTAMVRSLIDLGADVSAIDRSGNTPLDVSSSADIASEMETPHSSRRSFSP